MRKHRSPRHHIGTLIALLTVSTFANVVDVRAVATAATPAATAVTLHEGYIDVPAGHLFYRDSGGSGPVVLFMHPASGNSAVFEQQVEPLVRAGFRYIAYDRAGAGRSTRATGDAASRLATPELEQLMDALNVQRFHLVGAAAGGGVALQYALYRPSRVRSITVANSIGNVQDASYTEMGARLRPPAFNALPPEMRELGPSYRAVNPEGVKRWLELNGDAPGPGSMPGRGGPPGPGAGPAGPPPGAVPGGGSPVTFAALEKMTVPTLLITGSADLYTPPSVLRLFKQHMPKAEMEVFTESAHAAHWEEPAAFNRRLIAFLKKHRN